MLSDADEHTWYNQLSLGMHSCKDSGMCSPEHQPEKVINALVAAAAKVSARFLVR